MVLSFLLSKKKAQLKTRIIDCTWVSIA